MENRSIHILLKAVATSLCILLCAGAAAAAVIEGYVEEISGRQVKVRFEVSESPEIGDFVEFGQPETAGDGDLVNAWKVVRIESGRAWAEAAGAAPLPEPGTRALIYAASGEAAGSAAENCLRQGGATDDARIQREVVASLKTAQSQFQPAPRIREPKAPDQQGWLGVTLQMVTFDMAKAFGLAGPQGALVASIFSGGPAEKAGFEEDDVILNFGGVAISNCHLMPDLLAAMTPGKKVTAILWRDGRLVSKEVVMGVQPWAARKKSGEEPTRTAAQKDMR